MRCNPLGKFLKYLLPALIIFCLAVQECHAKRPKAGLHGKYQAQRPPAIRRPVR